MYINKMCSKNIHRELLKVIVLNYNNYNHIINMTTYTK